MGGIGSGRNVATAARIGAISEGSTENYGAHVMRMATFYKSII